MRVVYSTIDGQTINVLYSVQPPGMPPLKKLIPLPESPDCFATLLKYEPIVTEDVTQIPCLEPFADELLAFGIRAMLNAPLHHSDKLVGLLCVDSPTPRQWKEHEIVILTEIAEYLSFALKEAHAQQERRRAEVLLWRFNMSLERQVQKRTGQLQQALDFEATLKRITDKVRDSLDESHILQKAVQELALALESGCCNASLYDLNQGIATIHYEFAISLPESQGRVVQMANFPALYQQLLRGQYLQCCSVIPHPKRGRVAMLACSIVDDQGVLGGFMVNQSTRSHL